MSRQRFLVMAPDGRDASVIISLLGKAGIAGVAASADALLSAVAANDLGCAILTVDALRSLDPVALKFALAAQASWSDCPFLVLTSRNDRLGARSAFNSSGNVAILERPMHPDVLVRAVQQAFRARARQYKAEAHIVSREETEAQMRVLTETLEARVIARTVQLTDSLAERAVIAERLDTSEQQHRLTIELSNQIPWSADGDGRVVSVDPRWKSLMRLAEDDFTSREWMSRIHDDDTGRIADEWRQSRINSSPFDCELRVRMADGNYHTHRARASPHFGSDRSILKWYGTIENIEDSRVADARLQRLQSELAHLSRVSAMGAMASTLAHELNQPLTATTNFLRGIRRILARDTGQQHEQIIKALNAADQSASRAGEIVRRLREMVTKGGVAHRPEILAELIRETCALALIDAASQGISYRINMADEHVMIDADRIQIQQVLINLLRNAVEAIGETRGGEIVITVRTVETFSEIVVSDNGPGITDEVLSRLFESFNTSKSDGMGIGLSISRTIIEAHGGRIVLDKDHSPGTAVSFTVPNYVEPDLPDVDTAQSRTPDP